ncbi:MAG: isopeptide-forming domain-containing fimbrial protein [Lachnospiraceae bacterium]|nr:isopeptide-forming domain-containing fimbrial protein [Lachnospiraceae bacterium]
MRKMKKIASLMMALVMVLAMSVTAFASGETPDPAEESYTITINNAVDGYVYTAYQIFDGDLSEDGKTLSNVTWGSGIDSTNDELVAALTAKYGSADAATVAAKIVTTEDAAAFAEIIGTYVTTGTASGNSSPYSIAVTDPGYYLVINTTVPTTDSAYTDYILEVVTDVEVNPKAADVPGFEKEVGTTGGAATSTDYAIGDDVPFTLTATLPQGYSAYETYKLVFSDTLSEGLTFNEDVKVTVGGVEISKSDYTYSYDVTSNSFTVTIEDVTELAVEGVTIGAGTEIVVSYSATLNDNAGSVVENDASLSYSNDPNSSSTGTTGDKTYVVTFTVVVNKTDGTNALAGAAFTLYTKDEAGNYTVVAGTFEAGETTTFNFNGLAAGDYMLVESTTPDGYNTAAPVYFTINAAVTEDADSETGVTVHITDIDGFTTNDLTTTVTTTVVNNAGSSLPSTGGIGTTIFYVVGTVLVLGAAVVLITRRRMSSEA